MDSDRLPRKLTAILYADVAGYSRLTGDDEDITHRMLTEYLDLVSESIENHRGSVVHYAGDAVLARFEAVVDALSAAVAIQRELAARNEDFPNEQRVEFRIGVNLGDVIEDRGDIYGDGVNVAARLESLADPGGICISESVYTTAGNRLSLNYEDIGEQSVKNIANPVRAFKVIVQTGDESNVTSSRERVSEIYEKPSIAVLPFTNMSADPEQKFFADGITEDIIATLSQISDLFVTAGNSTFVYKDKPAKAQDIARDLGVRYILKGSVRRSEQRARITAQLVDATDGGHIWTERYDRDVEDIFEIQDEIARSIAIELQVQLTSGDHARVWQRGTRNFEAWQCLLRGMQLYYEATRESRIRAIELFEQAVAVDPDYDGAWQALGHLYAISARCGYSDDRAAALQRAEEIAESRMDKDLEADALNILANVRFSQQLYEDAVTAALRSVELAPNNANHHSLVAYILVATGQARRGLRHFNLATSLSPNYPNWLTDIVVLAHWLEGDLEAAREAAENAVARFPDYYLAYVHLTGTLSALGLYEQARETAGEVLRRQPDFSLREYGQRVFFQNPENFRSWIGYLRKAGLPE